MHTSFQLTIRGLSKETRDALQKKASKQGVSLNKYALGTLQRGVGIDANNSRYLEIKEFLRKHPIDTADKTAFDNALAWSDKASRDKQARDEHDTSL